MIFTEVISSYINASFVEHYTSRKQRFSRSLSPLCNFKNKWEPAKFGRYRLQKLHPLSRLCAISADVRCTHYPTITPRKALLTLLSLHGEWRSPTVTVWILHEGISVPSSACERERTKCEKPEVGCRSHYTGTVKIRAWWGHKVFHAECGLRCSSKHLVFSLTSFIYYTLKQLISLSHTNRLMHTFIINTT